MELLYQKFEFGIYVGGKSGTETGMTSGPPDNPKRIVDALEELQGSASSFLVRCYAGYHGLGKDWRDISLETQDYLKQNRKLDIVLCFQAEEDDMDGWRNFITTYILKYGQDIRYLQVTEEANVSLPSLDGYYANSRKALVEGIVHAKKVIIEHGFPIQVGFNATPDFNPNKTFWKEIRELAGRDFYGSLDYVGLDFFPGVFRPLPSYKPSDLEQLIANVIQAFRNDIAEAGISMDIPLHITENGYSTAAGSSEQQQSEMLSMIISILFRLRLQYNIHAYELFSLRDADSSIDDIFYQFGIMQDNYTPKQAFFTFKDLIRKCNI